MMKSFIYTLLLLALYGNAHAQLKTDSTTLQATTNAATQFSQYMQKANTGNAASMNAVGLCYMKGIGIAIDKAEGMKWFEKAAKSGYKKAWFNMGEFYKNDGDTPDYGKAYYCYSNAADTAFPYSLFMKAEMLYAGLGCRQDYNKAVVLYHLAAQLGSRDGMYCYGLCLRNGYGIAENTDSATYWLKKAAALQHQGARKELESKNAEKLEESAALKEALKVAASFNAPELSNSNKLMQYNDVPHNSINIKSSFLNGIFEGYMLRYDFSGQHLVLSYKLRLDMACEGDSIKGKWIENDSIVVQLRGLLTRTGVIFNNMEYSSPARYNRMLKWIFKNARLNCIQYGDSLYLTGNLQLFSPRNKEPDMPLSIVLTKTYNPIVDSQKINANEKLITALNATPNPFDNRLWVDIALQKDSRIQLHLLDMNGRPVYTGSKIELQAGKHTLPVLLKNMLPRASYVLTATCNRQIKSVIVIKN